MHAACCLPLADAAVAPPPYPSHPTPPPAPPLLPRQPPRALNVEAGLVMQRGASSSLHSSCCRTCRSGSMERSGPALTAFSLASQLTAATGGVRNWGIGRNRGRNRPLCPRPRYCNANPICNITQQTPHVLFATLFVPQTVSTIFHRRRPRQSHPHTPPRRALLVL